MNAALTGEFKRQIDSLRRALDVHGGDLTISGTSVYLSKQVLTTTSEQVAKLLAESTQKHFDEGGI